MVQIAIRSLWFRCTLLLLIVLFFAAPISVQAATQTLQQPVPFLKAAPASDIKQTILNPAVPQIGKNTSVAWGFKKKQESPNQRADRYRNRGAKAKVYVNKAKTGLKKAGQSLKKYYQQKKVDYRHFKEGYKR